MARQPARFTHIVSAWVQGGESASQSREWVSPSTKHHASTHEKTDGARASDCVEGTRQWDLCSGSRVGTTRTGHTRVEVLTDRDPDLLHRHVDLSRLEVVKISFYTWTTPIVLPWCGGCFPIATLVEGGVGGGRGGRRSCDIFAVTVVQQVRRWGTRLRCTSCGGCGKSPGWSRPKERKYKSHR